MNEGIKPKLAIIITHPIRYFVPLVQLLVQRGNITIRVFYTFGPELLKQKKYDPGYRAVQEPSLPILEGYDHEFVENVAKSKSSSKFAGIDNPTLIKTIEAWKPDVVLVLGWNLRSHLQAMKYFKGKIPVHFRGDSTLLDEKDKSWFVNLVRKFVLSRKCKYVDKAWYVGKNNKEYYLKFGLKEDQLVHVPHAVDNERFGRTISNVQQSLAIRSQFNIASDDVVFLFAGRFIPKKGIPDLLKAFKKIRNKKIHLLIVGDGPLKDEIVNEAWGFDNIHFLPRQTQTNMPAIYAAADIFVLPSKYNETWGLVLNEAMANGLAIIASGKCGSAADLVENGINGFVFNSGDIETLAEIMNNTSSDIQLLKRLKAGSLEKITAFSYHIAAKKIESALLCSLG